MAEQVDELVDHGKVTLEFWASLVCVGNEVGDSFSRTGRVVPSPGAFGDVLFVDRQGRVAEGSIWNIALWDGQTAIFPSAEMRMVPCGSR